MLCPSDSLVQPLGFFKENVEESSIFVNFVSILSVDNNAPRTANENWEVVANIYCEHGKHRNITKMGIPP